MKKILAVFATTVFVWSSAYAYKVVELERLVITPLKIESENIYQQVHTDVIEQKELEKTTAPTISDAFTGLEGIDVIGAGNFGSASLGVYMRGAKTRHTAYLLDGLKIYDPSNTSAYYVPYDFLLQGLESTEIVRFPVSSLYGSSPMGGIIQFRVKKPTQKPYISFSHSIGSHTTLQETLELGGEAETISYLLNVARIDTKGISKASRNNGNHEADPYQNTNVTFAMTHQKEGDCEGSITIKAIHSKTALDDDDNFDGIPEDDPDNLAWNNEFFLTSYIKKHINEIFAFRLQAGLTSIYRKYSDGNFGGADEFDQAWYKGKTYQCASHIEITPSDAYTMLFGFDYTREKLDGYRYTYNYPVAFGFENDLLKRTGYTKGWFIEAIANPVDKLEIDTSFRREENQFFNSHSIVKTAVAYSLFKDTSLFTSYGEGFKNPSLFQVYYDLGNQNLKPEESKTWEVGITQRLFKWGSLTFAYFHTNSHNLIDFVLTNPVFWRGQYQNAAKEKVRGIEISVEATPHENVLIEAGYSRLRGDEDFVDQDGTTIFNHTLIRVPHNKAFAKITVTKGKWNTSFDVSYSGKRFDRIWVGMFDDFVAMKPYLLGTLMTTYTVNDTFSAFFGITNIFDKDYERIKGFGEEPLSFYTGYKLTF